MFHHWPPMPVKSVYFMKTEMLCMPLISISPVFRTVFYIHEALKETHTHQHLSTTMQIHIHDPVERNSKYQCYRSQKLKIRISVDQRSHLGFMKKKKYGEYWKIVWYWGMEREMHAFQRMRKSRHWKSMWKHGERNMFSKHGETWLRKRAELSDTPSGMQNEQGSEWL